MAHINYASTVWSNASEVHLKKINSLHRRAAKLILPDHSLSTTAKLKKLDILPLQEQFVYNTAMLMFKIHMGWAPQYVCDLLNRAPARYESKNYVLPRTRIDLYEFCVLWVICLELSSSENENVQVCAWLQSRPS